MYETNNDNLIIIFLTVTQIIIDNDNDNIIYSMFTLTATTTISRQHDTYQGHRDKMPFTKVIKTTWHLPRSSRQHATYQSLLPPTGSIVAFLVEWNATIPCLWPASRLLLKCCSIFLHLRITVLHDLLLRLGASHPAYSPGPVISMLPGPQRHPGWPWPSAPSQLKLNGYFT